LFVCFGDALETLIILQSTVQLVEECTRIGEDSIQDKKQMEDHREIKVFVQHIEPIYVFRRDFPDEDPLVAGSAVVTISYGDRTYTKERSELSDESMAILRHLLEQITYETREELE
jgi:hypothetical protein